mgnify:CR=1 FL=1
MNKNGFIIEFINPGTDFAIILRKDYRRLYFYYSNDVILDVTRHLNGNLIKIKEFSIPIYRFIAPSVAFPCYVAYDLDEYVKFLLEHVKNKIRNKRILLSHSGGKDSTVSLIILLELKKYVNFDFTVTYSHVPFLESERHMRFVERVSQKLGIEIEMLEAPRDIFKKSLKEMGLPYRGFRWCTYLKIKPVKQRKKELKADFEVVGDRISEGFKRFSSLVQYALQRTFISGKQFRPVYLLTLLDIIKIVRERDLVHPDYLRGMTRISCDLCPYRPVYEINELFHEVEDPGFIEQILREEYKRLYSGIASFEDYMTYALWRYHPDQARTIMKIRKNFNEHLDAYEKALLKNFRLKLKTPWANRIPEASKIEIDVLIHLLKQLAKKPKYTVIPIEEI